MFTFSANKVTLLKIIMFVCIYVYVFMCVCVCLDGYYNNYNNKMMWSLFILAFFQTAFFILTRMSCCHINEMLSIISTARTSRIVFFLIISYKCFQIDKLPIFPFPFLCFCDSESSLKRSLQSSLAECGFYESFSLSL